MNLRVHRSVALVALSTTAAAALGTYSWCSAIGGCTFGKYKGSVTFTNLTKEEPVDRSEVRYFINNGDYFLTNSGKNFYASTDINGESFIEFDRAFYSPLTITLYRSPEETKAQFYLSLFNDFRQRK